MILILITGAYRLREIGSFDVIDKKGMRRHIM